MNLTKLKAMGEFDENWAYNLAKTHDFGPLSEVGSRVACARYQHTKDKALNEPLMRIVERQSEALEHVSKQKLRDMGGEYRTAAAKVATEAIDDIAKLIEEFKP